MEKIINIDLSMLKELVEMHKTAFKNYQSVKLGNPYLKFFFKWFIINKEAISLCLTDENKILGYVLGAPSGYNKDLFKYTFFSSFLSLILRPYLLFDIKILKKIYLKVKAIFSYKKSQMDFPEPKINLVGIGVHNNSMRKGYGSLLMDKFEEEAKKRGYKTMALTVFKNNLSARKLYEKKNWKSIDTKFDYLIYFKEI